MVHGLAVLGSLAVLSLALAVIGHMLRVNRALIADALRGRVRDLTPPPTPARLRLVSVSVVPLRPSLPLRAAA